MKFLNGLMLFFLLGTLCVSAADPAELPTEDFVKRLRTRQTSSTYGIFTGTVQHQRRGGELLTEPIRFAVLLAPERTTGQVVIGGRSGFIIGQEVRPDNAVSTVVPMAGSAERDLAGYMGIRAADLALGFVFWPLVKELSPSRVGVVACRVLLLRSPDGKELLRLYCATRYCFPLKAEFFPADKADLDKSAPVRTVEISAFGEKNELYYARSIHFSGPGWRTRVEFSADSAVVAPFDASNPIPLFLPSLQPRE